MSHTIAIDLCGLPKIDFCCNYFEVLHLYKLPASAYFIRYIVRGGTFDLAVEVTQMYILYVYGMATDPMPYISKCFYVNFFKRHLGSPYVVCLCMRFF